MKETLSSKSFEIREGVHWAEFAILTKDVRGFISDNLFDLDNLINHTNLDNPTDCACYICHHQEEFKDVFRMLKEKQIKRAGEELVSVHEKAVQNHSPQKEGQLQTDGDPGSNPGSEDKPLKKGCGKKIKVHKGLTCFCGVCGLCPACSGDGE